MAALPVRLSSTLYPVVVAQLTIIGALTARHTYFEEDLAIGRVDRMCIRAIFEDCLEAGVERMLVGAGHDIAAFTEGDLIIIEVVGGTGHGLAIHAACATQGIAAAIEGDAGSEAFYGAFCDAFVDAVTQGGYVGTPGDEVLGGPAGR